MRKIQVVSRDRPANVDPGPAPMQQWINIEQLVVDDQYQRELKSSNWKAIRRIAADFKWSRFSPVFCAPVEGGVYAIIDGQHRTHAAAMCGFDSVPCQIVQMTRDEQAASFAAVNGMVTKVTTGNLFKAAVAAGEPQATEAKRVAEAAGCRLMTSNGSAIKKQPGQIYAPKGFTDFVSAVGSDKVERALKILMAAEGYRDAVEVWEWSLLQAILSAVTAKPAYLASPALVETLEDFPLWDAVDNIRGEIRRKLRLGLPYETKKVALRGVIERLLETRLVVAA